MGAVRMLCSAPVVFVQLPCVDLQNPYAAECGVSWSHGHPILNLIPGSLWCRCLGEIDPFEPAGA
jgi:hypothetical protein